MSEFDDLLARVRSTESPLTPKTTNADDYSGLLARVRGGQDQTAAQASLNASVYTNPDLEGEKQRLAKELKNRFNEDWSPTAINVDEARRRLQTSTGADLMQNAPALAGRMVNSDFAKVAHDDIPILTATEYQAALLKREQRPSTYLEDIKDVSIKALQGVISGPQMVVGLADIQTGGWAGKMLEKLGYDPQEAKDILSTYYSESQQRAERKVQEAQGFVEKTKEALLNPRVIGGTIIESLASMLVGGVISKLLPFGTPLVRGAIGEGIVGAGSAAEQIRTGNEEGLLNLKETVSAVGSGVGTALFSLLGGRVAQKLGIDDVDTLMATKGATPATNKMVGRRVLESMFSEGILEEMPQSMQEQMWQNYAEDKPIFEDVDQAGVLGMFAGMAMGGGTQLLGLPSEWKRDRAKAETAKENASALARIAELAAESKLRERNPDQYESLVQDQFQGSNAENIYIDGQQLANVLNQGGMTKEQLALTLPEVASQIDQAIATGGDVIIPTAKFAARLATTDVGKALIEHARMDPDDISKAEAGVVDEKKNEMLDAAKKQQREKQMQSEEFIKSAKEVEGLMLKQNNIQTRLRAPTLNLCATLW